jgi:hypothetical protein
VVFEGIATDAASPTLRSRDDAARKEADSNFVHLGG